MTFTLTLIAVLLAVNVRLIQTSPYRDEFLRSLTVIAPLTFVVVALGTLVVWLLSKRVSQQAPRVTDAHIYHRRVLVVLAGLIVFELFVLSLFSHPIAAEAAYYLGLVAGGVILALRCGARSYVPLLSATLVLLAVSIVASIRFVGDPGAQFQYGPERYLFAIWQHAQRANLLLLDVAVMWFAWRISLQVSVPRAEAAAAS